MAVSVFDVKLENSAVSLEEQMRVSARLVKADDTVQVEVLHVSSAKPDDGLQKGILRVRCAKPENGALLKVLRQWKMHAPKNVLKEPTALKMERHLSFPVLIVPKARSQIRRANLLVLFACLEHFNPVLVRLLALCVMVDGTLRIMGRHSVNFAKQESIPIPTEPSVVHALNTRLQKLQLYHRIDATVSWATMV